jgi:SOS response regulatory protein OraA/RecX
MSRWGEQFNDPAVRQRREHWIRQYVERHKAIDEAIAQAKLGNPHLLLDLIEPDDVRRAIDDAELLPQGRKPGRPRDVLLSNSVQWVLRRLARLRAASGKESLPKGTRPLVIKEAITRLDEQQYFISDAAFCAALRNAEGRMTKSKKRLTAKPRKTKS